MKATIVGRTQFYLPIKRIQYISHTTKQFPLARKRYAIYILLLLLSLLLMIMYKVRLCLIPHHSEQIYSVMPAVYILFVTHRKKVYIVFEK